MAQIEDVVKAEYELILDIWKFERKWLEKIPLTDTDWNKMMDEANEMAEKRKGKAQDLLCSILNTFCDEIEFIDKQMGGGKQ
jgi:hypothetical protein